MWMTEYIEEIKKQMRSVYGFKLNGDVPDGEYPMEIDGKLDHVRIVNDRIYCCNFDQSQAS